ncbi:MAG: hypothetical protein SQA66_09215 [Candidatus Fervidibacter sacchari]
MLTTFPIFTRPFPDNHPSTQPFTFFILPETSTVSEPVIPILERLTKPFSARYNGSRGGERQDG